MFNNKEDVYKGYSESNPNPLKDPPQAEANFAENAQSYAQPESQSPYAQQPYAQPPQQPYAQPAQQAPYGQQPYAPQPNFYGQPAYPYTGAQPRKEKNTGKIVAIVIACIVARMIGVIFFICFSLA